MCSTRTRPWNSTHKPREFRGGARRSACGYGPGRRSVGRGHPTMTRVVMPLSEGRAAELSADRRHHAEATFRDNFPTDWPCASPRPRNGARDLKTFKIIGHHTWCIIGLRSVVTHRGDTPATGRFRCRHAHPEEAAPLLPGGSGLRQLVLTAPLPPTPNRTAHPDTCHLRCSLPTGLRASVISCRGMDRADPGNARQCE
jgi:hypothetical protein